MDFNIFHEKNFGDILLDMAIIFAPTLGYISQYTLIKEERTVGSFSIDVCAILIFANILRICFWFGKQFDNALLAQSFVMIVCQIMLLKLCVKTNQNYQIKTRKFDKKRYDLTCFWRWDELDSFYLTIVLFAIGSCMFTYFCLESSLVVEGIGFASVAIEACLGLPQLIKNISLRNTSGLSYGMIAAWFFGDLMKTFYFVYKNQPSQFIICGLVQLSVDIIIIYQINKYNN